MTPKISLVTVLAVALVAVPAAWGGQAPDAFERAVTAKLASQSLPQPNPRGMLASDSVESARAGSAVQPSRSARLRLGREREAAGSAVQPSPSARIRLGREREAALSRSTPSARLRLGREREG